MIDDEANIFRVAALARVKAETEARERTDKEVSAVIRARMESRQPEIEGIFIGEGQGQGRDEGRGQEEEEGKIGEGEDRGRGR